MSKKIYDKFYLDDTLNVRLYACDKFNSPYISELDITGLEIGLEDFKNLLKKYDLKQIIRGDEVWYNTHKSWSAMSENDKCIMQAGVYRDDRDNDVYIPWVRFLYTQDYDVDALIADLLPYKDIEEKKNNNIYFLLYQHENFSLKKIKLPEVKIDPSLYYHNLDYELLKEKLSSKCSGITFFSGVPGSGKSFLIKHLTKEVKKKFIFVPADMVSSLSDASFFPFVLGEMKDSILVIEDAENVLRSRKNSMNSIVSVILNYSDGLLGDATGIQFLVTQNNEENTDTALLRKGRMLFCHKFEALPVEKANQVAEQIGVKPVFNKPTVLADIFNYNDNDYNEKSNKVGFIL